MFKTVNAHPHSPVEIGDTNYKKHYTGVNRSMLFEEIEPAIRQATVKYILPFIGQQFYDFLADEFDSGSLVQEKIITALQDAIAYYTAYHLFPEKNGFLASLGVVQNTPSDGSGQPINQWGWKAKRWAALENADTFLDKLLELMEEQVQTGTPDFGLWTNHKCYKDYS
jgi:hypothetical protein